MLPDRSLLIVEEMVKNPKIWKSDLGDLGDFQTLWELLLSFLKTQQSTLIWVSSDIEVDY